MKRPAAKFVGPASGSGSASSVGLSFLLEMGTGRGAMSIQSGLRRGGVQIGPRESTASPCVLLTFAPGETCQFDWRHEIVVLDGVTRIVKVARVRLSNSRMMFVRLYRAGDRGRGAHRAFR